MHNETHNTNVVDRFPAKHRVIALLGAIVSVTTGMIVTGVLPLHPTGPSARVAATGINNSSSSGSNNTIRPAVRASVAGPPAAPKPVPSVWVYGDSLTAPAAAELITRTSATALVTVHAFPGTDLPVWEPEIRASTPTRLVLALGTNDAPRMGTLPWRDLLESLPSSTCVVWPRTFRSGPAVVEFDNEMELLAAKAGVHVIDWDSRVESHREWLLPDGVHYNAAGTSAYASMLAEAVASCAS